MINKITKILFIVLIMLCISPVFVFADDNTSNETWTDDNGNTYEVEHQQITDSSIENGKYMPTSVTGQKFEGTGTVVDYVQTDTKTFYTIFTADDKIYYLIIDNTKDNNNVYFLREINEDELNFGYQYEVVNNNPYAEDEVVQVERVEKTNLPDTKTLITLGIVVLCFVGCLLIIKLKKKPAKEKQSESTTETIDIPDDMYGDEDEDINVDEVLDQNSDVPSEEKEKSQEEYNIEQETQEENNE